MRFRHLGVCVMWLLLPSVMAIDSQEFNAKVERARAFYLQENLAGLILADPANVNWMLGGDAASSVYPPGGGAPAFLVTGKSIYLIAADGELQHVQNQFAKSLVIASTSIPWTGALGSRKLYLEAERLIPQRIGTDTMPLPARPLSRFERRVLYGDKAEEKKDADPVTDRLQMLGARMRALRFPLLDPELERYRAFGKQLARVCESVARQIEVGQSDFEITALAARELYRQELVPVSIRIALDDTAMTASSVAPRGETLARFAQISLTARKSGLHASVTRLVHFGPVPEKLAKRQNGVTKTMAGLIEALKPGQKVAEMIKPVPPPGGQEKVARVWQALPLGWSTGYQEKEFFLSPIGQEFVDEGMVCVLQPQLEGARIEETVRLESKGFEILTAPGDWPVLELTVRGQSLKLPGILVR